MMILAPTPSHRQGRLPLAQVAQRPSQPSSGYLQRWGIHSFSGQSVPVQRHVKHVLCLKAEIEFLIRHIKNYSPKALALLLEHI